jgi:polyhydroxyalkanoate synthesis repressor PhaR
MRTIKRYRNRKLYDTTERHYVTLADVAEFVRKGDEVKVVDYVSMADLTAQTFAQIIFEEEKEALADSTRHSSLGSAALSKIIKSGIPDEQPAS